MGPSCRGCEWSMNYGEGSVFKHKDAKGRTFWKVEVVIGHKPDGTRVRTRRTAKTHADALQIRRQLVTDRDEYQLKFDNPTLDAFAIWWIRDVRALRVFTAFVLPSQTQRRSSRLSKRICRAKAQI